MGRCNFAAPLLINNRQQWKKKSMQLRFELCPPAGGCFEAANGGKIMLDGKSAEKTFHNRMLMPDIMSE
jgi:hypothetical protein